MLIGLCRICRFDKGNTRMGWEFNVDTRARSCAQCARDTSSDMSAGSHSFTFDRIRATIAFAGDKTADEPICRKCAADLLRLAADELEA